MGILIRFDERNVKYNPQKIKGCYPRGHVVNYREERKLFLFFYSIIVSLRLLGTW